MHENCIAYQQPPAREACFYYGPAYASYGLSVVTGRTGFIGWRLTMGISLNIDRINARIVVDAILLLALQLLMRRTSRTTWLAFLDRYIPGWSMHEPAVRAQ